MLFILDPVRPDPQLYVYAELTCVYQLAVAFLSAIVT